MPAFVNVAVTFFAAFVSLLSKVTPAGGFPTTLQV